jgi:excisionase family DNA binding protein
MDANGTNATPMYHTIEEAADILRASITTIRRYIREGQLKAVQPAGKCGLILIPAEALKPYNLAQVWNCTVTSTTTTPAPHGTTTSLFDPTCRVPKWALGLPPVQEG